MPNALLKAFEFLGNKIRPFGAWIYLAGIALALASGFGLVAVAMGWIYLIGALAGLIHVQKGERLGMIAVAIFFLTVGGISALTGAQFVGGILGSLASAVVPFFIAAGAMTALIEGLNILSK